MQSDTNPGEPSPSPMENATGSPPPASPPQDQPSYSASAPPSPPDVRQPFGGAPVEPTPARPSRPGRPLLTCLGAAIVLGILVIAVVFFLLSRFSEFLSGAPLTRRVTSSTVGLVRIDDLIMDERKVLDVIDHYAEKDDIRAILVRVDSPGGAVGPSQEIYEGIRRLREKGKKVVASMGSVAASGGYYVACAADEVYANPGTLTGSIGVLIGIPNLKGIADKIGFEYQVVKSGKFKDIGSTTRPLTPEERELMQELIDDVYNQFVGAILHNRSARIETALAALGRDEATSLTGSTPPRNAEEFLRAIADGRILTGRQAVRYGLADYEGAQNDALDRVAEMAGIEKPKLYEYRPRRPLTELFEASAKSALETAGLPIRGMRIEYRLPY